MPHADKKARAAYNKEYGKRRVQFKKDLLAQFPCLLCGESDPDLIDWRHVYPEEKLFGLAGKTRIQEDTWWDEVLKCIPVCVLCHRKIHTNKLCLIFPTAFKPAQDTENTYVRVCTCPP